MRLVGFSGSHRQITQISISAKAGGIIVEKWKLYETIKFGADSECRMLKREAGCEHVNISCEMIL
jgi:hypothetical protein